LVFSGGLICLPISVDFGGSLFSFFTPLYPMIGRSPLRLQDIGLVQYILFLHHRCCCFLLFPYPYLIEGTSSFAISGSGVNPFSPPFPKKAEGFSLSHENPPSSPPPKTNPPPPSPIRCGNLDDPVCPPPALPFPLPVPQPSARPPPPSAHSLFGLFPVSSPTSFFHSSHSIFPCFHLSLFLLPIPLPSCFFVLITLLFFPHLFTFLP